ncbi:MAG: WbqC family protein, partial [Pseudomonadota bacterium]
MIVSINQPAYLPWLGYFHRIARSDLHIVLDHVQFEKHGFIHRNRVKSAMGWCWLTVPVRTGGRFGNISIKTAEIDNTRDWARKHRMTLEQSYGNAPYFNEHQAFFDEIF